MTEKAIQNIAERQQVEQALACAAAETERQRQLLAVTLASIGDGVIVTDAQGRVTFLNGEAQRLTGWPQEQAAGRPLDEVFRIVNEQTRQRVEDPARKVLRLGKVVGLANHTILIARDGTETPIDDSGAPVRDAEGKVHGVVLVFRDFSAQKAAESALHRLNRTLRAHSASDQAMVRAKDEAQYLEEVCRIIVEDCGHAMVWIGYAENDEGRTVRPVAHSGFEEGYLETLKITWDDTERGRGPTGTAIRTGQVCMCRNMLTDPRFTPWRAEALKRGYASSIVLPLMREGKAFGALTIYCRAPDSFSEDEVRLLTSLAADLAYGISAIRLRDANARAEESLRLSEEKFAMAFAGNPAAIALTRLDDGRFLEVNDTWLALTEYSREEVIGLSAKSLPIWPTPEARARFVEELREKRSLSAWEQGFLTKSGKTFVAQLSAQVLSFRGEGLILSTLVDITNRKRAEEQLLAAKTALEQAAAAKDQFIAKLSHELRTPLTPVVAAISVLARDGRIPEDMQEDMRLVERNIGLEVHLINDLLDVTRIVNGKLELRKEPVNVAEVLKEAGRIVSSDLDAKAQTLTIDMPGAPYWVDADRARLHQVFWNLLKNAIKFSPERARLAVQAAAGDGVVRIAVKDPGQGIASVDLPRLFRAFEQGAAGQGFGGLGLGLAICKGIVDLHGGRIMATSEGKGKGATFTMEFPLLPVAPGMASPMPANARFTAKGPLRILLVEDHEDTARVMGRLLRAEDHDVTWAASVKEALAAAESGSFDVMVSDLGLPDGSGYDLMRQLLAAGKKLRGIAVSGYGTAEDVQRSLAAGFAEHVTKPISFDALHHALVRAAHGGQAELP